jgi:hypothetical protein
VSYRIQFVESPVHGQDVDGWLADETEDWLLDVGVDDLADGVSRDGAGAGDPIDLKLGVGGRNIRIQARARGRDCVVGDLLVTGRLAQRLSVTFDPFGQIGV